MSDDLESILAAAEAGVGGPLALDHVGRLRADGELRSQLHEELLLRNLAAGDTASREISLIHLDRFLNGGLRGLEWLQICSACATSEALWRDLQKIAQANEAAESLPDGEDDIAVHEARPAYRAIELLGSHPHQGHLVMSGYAAAYDYTYRAAGTATLSAKQTFSRIDQVVVTGGRTVCTVAADPATHTVNVSFSPLPLSRERFREALIELRAGDVRHQPAERLLMEGMALAHFSGIDLEIPFTLVIDPELLG